MSKRELSQAQLAQRAAAHRKHGGEAAVYAIHQGRELTGLAAQAEREVRDELETAGRSALVVRTATRLQAAADLYWNAIQAAAEQGSIKDLDGYIARFGWLAGAALRAWAQVKAERPDDGGALDYEAILEGARRDDD